MRCPFCNHILEDKWLKKQGAALMGKASGAAKARSRDQARAASLVRWNQEKQKAEKEFQDLRTLAGVRQPKKKPKR